MRISSPQTATISGLMATGFDTHLYPPAPYLIDSLLLATGATYTGGSKAAEVSHNANTYKVVSVFPVPWWVSPRSVVKFACETKATAAGGRVDFTTVHNRAIGSVITEGLGAENSQAGWNEVNAAYTAHNVNLNVFPGQLIAVLLKMAGGTVYMQNAVITYNITGADQSRHTGWLGTV